MPRQARLLVPGYPHHITHKANRSEWVFRTSQDFSQYLNFAKKYQKKLQIEIWAYCLMSNHVHYIIRPKTTLYISRFIGYTHLAYSKWFNSKNSIQGHLWQERFFSCLMDEPHAIRAIRYIERNPVEARLVEKAENYLWSSARYRVSGTQTQFLEPTENLPYSVSDWRSFLIPISKTDSALIEHHLMTGFPMGSLAFIESMECRFGRKLRPCHRPINW